MKDRSPLLSVIIVNYNAGPLLVECVSAVLASEPALEVWVSDNASADDSIGLLRQRHGHDPRLRVLENDRNLGFARGNNLALAHARGAYVLFLNPDCIVGPATLGRMLGFMEDTRDAGMAGCLILDPDGSEQKAARRRIPDPWVGLVRFLRLERLSSGRIRDKRLNLGEDPLPDRPVAVEAISGSFMLVRRAALDEVGPLDEGYFLHCEDLDWFVRFARRGWKVYFVPDAEVVHHQGTCSTGSPVRVEWHKHKGMVRFFRKFQFDRYPLPFSLLVVLGIWLHFALVALLSWLRRIPRRILGGARP
jgi:GT2 family glycosyltransferase